MDSFKLNLEKSQTVNVSDLLGRWTPRIPFHQYPFQPRGRIILRCLENKLKLVYGENNEMFLTIGS